MIHSATGVKDWKYRYLRGGAFLLCGKDGKAIEKIIEKMKEEEHNDWAQTFKERCDEEVIKILKKEKTAVHKDFAKIYGFLKEVFADYVSALNKTKPIPPPQAKFCWIHALEL